MEAVLNGLLNGLHPIIISLVLQFRLMVNFSLFRHGKAVCFAWIPIQVNGFGKLKANEELQTYL